MNKDIQRPAQGAAYDPAPLAARLLVIIVVAGLFALPFSQIFLGSDTGAVYEATAADVFYYLKLADSTTLYGFPTMDGETVSNGYMPFWQGIVVPLDLVTGDTRADPHQMVLVAFYASFAPALFGLARLAVFVADLFGWRAGPQVWFWAWQASPWRATSTGSSKPSSPPAIRPRPGHRRGQSCAICLLRLGGNRPGRRLRSRETPCRRARAVLETGSMMSGHAEHPEPDHAPLSGRRSLRPTET